MAREVADDTCSLMAGGVSNTKIYEEGNKETKEIIKASFEEQVFNMDFKPVLPRVEVVISTFH